MEKSEKISALRRIFRSEGSDSDGAFLRNQSWIKKNLLLIVTVLGVIFGIIIGFCLRPCNLGPKAIILIAYPGELFMRILKLMILPLVIASLITGSASLNARMNGKIAARTLTYFILTSMFNALFGICLVLFVHPGDPRTRHLNILNSATDRNVNMFDSLLDLGRNLFPDNLFQATLQQAYTVYAKSEPMIFNSTLNSSDISNATNEFTSMTRVIKYRSGINTLGIVFFCLVFGTVLGTIGPKGQVVMDFFSAIFETVMKIVIGIMWLTPVGVGSIIAGKILAVQNLGLIISQLGWFIATVAFGVFFYQLIILQLIYFVFVRKNPYLYYLELIQPALTACAASSTAAALPVTFRVMNERLKMDPRITKFILPIGCNINMDGTALFLAISSIFIAQMNDIHLGFGELITVFLTATAASMSGSSVPSSALVTILLILSAIEAPTDDVSLLFAVDWFVDRMRTTNNMLSDCYAVAVIEELSKEELLACDKLSACKDSPVTQNEMMIINSDVESGLIEIKTVSHPTDKF